MTDTVPHVLAEDVGDDVVEPDGTTDPLTRVVTVEQNDTVTIGEDEIVVEIVGDLESVPDPDCDTERVPHDDAEKESDTVSHALADGDGVDIGEPDALSDQLFELQPDDVNEFDRVAKVDGEVESEAETDGDDDCETHVDAV